MLTHREGSISDILTGMKRLPVFAEDYGVTTAHSNLAEGIVGGGVYLLKADKVASERRGISGRLVDRAAECRADLPT